MPRRGKNASAIWHTQKSVTALIVRVAAFYLFIRIPRHCRRRRLALFPITLEALGARSQKAWPRRNFQHTFSANLFQLELKKSIIEARARSLFLSPAIPPVRPSYADSLATFKMKK